MTDYSNASRTMLFNINTLAWDEDILKDLDIPVCMLPEVKPSSCIYGRDGSGAFSAAPIPIARSGGRPAGGAVWPDLFPGRRCEKYLRYRLFPSDEYRREAGLFRATALSRRSPGALDGKVNYALEGSIFVAGAAIQWLRDETASHRFR